MLDVEHDFTLVFTSAVIYISGFNLVAGVSVEYMHCVLQGVCRQITEALFNTANCSQRFYAGMFFHFDSTLFVTLSHIFA